MADPIKPPKPNFGDRFNAFFSSGSATNTSFWFQDNLANKIDDRMFREAVGDIRHGAKPTTWGETIARSAYRHESDIVGGFNKINAKMQKFGIGTASTFSTYGDVIKHTPLKHMAGRTFGMMALGIPLEMFMGGNSFGTAVSNTMAYTIASEIAGSSLKRQMLVPMGYQAVGSMMGMGAWGSLGLQIAGQYLAPGLGWALAGAAGAYHVGRGLVDLHKKMYDLGKSARSTEFGTGDTSYQSANAATMRQRSMSAIQNSHLNMRSMLGNEANILAGRLF